MRTNPRSPHTILYLVARFSLLISFSICHVNWNVMIALKCRSSNYVLAWKQRCINMLHQYILLMSKEGFRLHSLDWTTTCIYLTMFHRVIRPVLSLISFSPVIFHLWVIFIAKICLFLPSQKMDCCWRPFCNMSQEVNILYELEGLCKCLGGHSKITSEFFLPFPGRGTYKNFDFPSFLVNASQLACWLWPQNHYERNDVLFLNFLICCFNIVIFQAPKPEPPAVKAPKKTTAKAATDEKKGKTAEVTKEEPLDPVAEKLRQQRLILSTSILNFSFGFPLSIKNMKCLLRRSLQVMIIN